MHIWNGQDVSDAYSLDFMGFSAYRDFPPVLVPSRVVASWLTVSSVDRERAALFLPIIFLLTNEINMEVNIQHPMGLGLP